MPQQATDIVLGCLADLSIAFFIPEQIAVTLPEALVGTHAGAVVAEDWFRHERGGLAVPPGDIAPPQLLALTLLVSAAWLQAQDQYGSQAGSSQTGTTPGQTTVQGCLQSSDGNYTLTDKSGTTYQLHGNTSKLSAHVGHEVQITGSTSGSSGTSSSMGTQAGGTLQPTLTVESMKHVSKTCHSTTGK